MILWTIQHEMAYEKMKDTGVLRADEAYVLEDVFKTAYP